MIKLFKLCLYIHTIVPILYCILKVDFRFVIRVIQLKYPTKTYQYSRSRIIFVLHNIKLFSKQSYILLSNIHITCIIGIILLQLYMCFETGGRIETVGIIKGQLQQVGNTLRVCKCVTDVAVYILNVHWYTGTLYVTVVILREKPIL